MSTRVVLGLVAAVASAMTPVLVAGQSAGQPVPRQSAAPATPYQVPMTPWGHPDLQGTWDYRSITPLERAARFGDRAFYTDEEVKEMEARAARRMDEPPAADAPAGTIHADYWTDPGRYVEESRRTSLIVDPPNGRVPPLTEEARARQAGRRGGGAGPNRQGGRADSWLDRTPLERCITWGLPTAILPGLYNNNIEIVQSPTEVAIIHEMVHDTRVIPLDGRPHLSNELGQWMGHSRARWDGQTLVVETTNFSPKISYRGASPNLRLTERFTRVAPDRIEFSLTVEDPSTWVAPWTAQYSMRPSEGPIYEYACHEGNYGLRNILEVARDEEKAAAEAAGQK
jgi:hypothetical protein